MEMRNYIEMKKFFLELCKRIEISNYRGNSFAQRCKSFKITFACVVEGNLSFIEIYEIAR